MVGISARRGLDASVSIAQVKGEGLGLLLPVYRAGNEIADDGCNYDDDCHFNDAGA